MILASLTDGSGRGRSIGGSRLVTEGIVSDEVKEILRKIDPIDSLYFDVSVARHFLEEGDNARALEWLDPRNALGELKRSYSAGLLTEDEFNKIGQNIIDIQKALPTFPMPLSDHEWRVPAALAIITPLQQMLAEKAYTTFRELDPVPDDWIDGRYEATRERKVAEWRAQGIAEGLIEKGLKWGNEWARGIAQRFIKDPTLRAQVAESLYPESLTLSEKWMTAMAK